MFKGFFKCFKRYFLITSKYKENFQKLWILSKILNIIKNFDFIQKFWILTKNFNFIKYFEFFQNLRIFTKKNEFYQPLELKKKTIYRVPAILERLLRKVFQEFLHKFFQRYLWLFDSDYLGMFKAFPYRFHFFWEFLRQFLPWFFN